MICKYLVQIHRAKCMIPDGVVYCTSVVMTPWGWHIGAETCSSWCMSQMVFHGVHLLDDTSINHTGCCANVVTPIEMKNFDKPKSALYISLCCVVLYGSWIAHSVYWPGCRINDRVIDVRLRTGTRDLSRTQL